jgi:hypothetical protein
VKLNKGGLIVAGIYVMYFAAFYGYSYLPSVRYPAPLVALSFLPAGLFFTALSPFCGDSGMPFSPDSWLNSDWLYFLESLVISYLFGWAANVFINVRDPASPPVGEDTPDWHKR